MKKSVKDYLRDIESVYKTAAQAIADDYEALTKLREDRHAVPMSKELTRKGQEKKINEIDEQIKVIDADMYALRQDANKRAAEIRQNIDKMFYNYFHANAGDVDMQMMTLINSGVLSDTELLRMSENANTTMKRLIGRALENSKEGLYVAEGRQMQAMTTNPHLRAADGLIGIGDYACGGARLSGASAAKMFLAKWEETVEPVINSAPNVVYNSDALKPGESWFTEE